MTDPLDTHLVQVFESLRFTLTECMVAADRARVVAESAADVPLPNEKDLARLRKCVRGYTIAAKGNGMLPEHVLLRIKEVIREIRPSIDEREPLFNAAIAWSLGSYFEDE